MVHRFFMPERYPNEHGENYYVKKWIYCFLLISVFCS
nr:MAG TPA_asm: hypothetical protein [Caudoviricetes sp.]